MNLDELGEDAKRENILAIMILMSQVDGVISDNELRYIVLLGLSLGMAEDRIRTLTVHKDTALFVPSSEEERMTIFYYLIFLIKVDEIISEEEKDMLHHFGLKLGFGHLMVANIIRIIQANIGRKLPADALLKEIRKHLN